MTQLAGMRREERWADWTRSPFTADSPAHVSVCREDEHRRSGRGERG